MAGGLAMVAHGHVRFTAGLDLIVDLREPNLRRAMTALGNLGYKPRTPVQIEQFADAETRAGWVRDKGLTVLPLCSDLHPATEVDVFVDDPLGFDDAYLRAVRLEVAPGIEATFVALDDLIRLKRAAGRAEDLLDIERLEAIRGDRRDD